MGRMPVETFAISKKMAVIWPVCMSGWLLWDAYAGKPASDQHSQPMSEHNSSAGEIDILILHSEHSDSDWS